MLYIISNHRLHYRVLSTVNALPTSNYTEKKAFVNTWHRKKQTWWLLISVQNWIGKKNFLQTNVSWKSLTKTLNESGHLHHAPLKWVGSRALFVVLVLGKDTKTKAKNKTPPTNPLQHTWTTIALEPLDNSVQLRMHKLEALYYLCRCSMYDLVGALCFL